MKCPSKQTHVHHNLCINALISMQFCISLLHHFIICSIFCYFFHIWRRIVPHLGDERLNWMEVQWNITERTKTKDEVKFSVYKVTKVKKGSAPSETEYSCSQYKINHFAILSNVKCQYQWEVMNLSTIVHHF